MSASTSLRECVCVTVGVSMCECISVYVTVCASVCHSVCTCGCSVSVCLCLSVCVCASRARLETAVEKRGGGVTIMEIRKGCRPDAAEGQEMTVCSLTRRPLLEVRRRGDESVL